MPDAHAHGSLSVLALLLPGLLVAAGAAYLTLVSRPAPRGRGWPVRRTVTTLTGVALTVWALLGPLNSPAEGWFAAHMAQHLIVGMLGPFLVVLGAPLTLLLSRGPLRWRRPIGRLLHLPPVRFVAHPVVALLLSVGSLPVLYGTSLIDAAMHSDLLHVLIHVHFFASGYLFAWVICGPDPAPKRPSVPARLVVLGVAVLVHSVVSQLLYAGWFPVVADGADLRLGATLMYYGGDLIELALALTLVAGWRPSRSARPVRTAVI